MSGNYYFGFDGQGSVWDIMHDSGIVDGSYTYTAFGNTTLIEWMAEGNNFRYVGALGYWADDENGLMLLGQRWYNPSIGRFLTIDPIKDGRNWYAYVGNRPLSMIDQSGELAFLIPIGAALARCLANRLCRSLVACLGALVGRGIYEIYKESTDGRDRINWCQVGCKSLCSCAGAGIGGAIPKELIIAIFGVAMGTALGTPACTDQCDKICKDDDDDNDCPK